MENTIKQDFVCLNVEEQIHIEAGGFFWDLGKAVGNFTYNYLDDIASGKLAPVHSGMLAR